MAYQKCTVTLTSEELITLEQLALNHRWRDVRTRATGLLRLSKGEKPKAIAQALGVSHQPVYDWVHFWRERGIVGLLGGHMGGRSLSLPPAMLDTAEAVARTQALSLSGIAKAIEAEHQQPLPCCLVTLSTALKKRGFSFKRTRFSLKKSVLKRNSL
jgi:transposase